MKVNVNYNYVDFVDLQSSPPGLCPKGRSSDIDAILNVMHNAQQFIYIAVMDYFPMTIYTYPQRFVIISLQLFYMNILNKKFK